MSFGLAAPDAMQDAMVQKLPRHIELPQLKWHQHGQPSKEADEAWELCMDQAKKLVWTNGPQADGQGPLALHANALQRQ